MFLEDCFTQRGNSFCDSIAPWRAHSLLVTEYQTLKTSKNTLHEPYHYFQRSKPQINLAKPKIYMLVSLLTQDQSSCSARTWTHSLAHFLFLEKHPWVQKVQPQKILGGPSRALSRWLNRLSQPERELAIFGHSSNCSETRQNLTSKSSTTGWTLS